MNGNLTTTSTNLAVIVLLFVIVGNAIVVEGCKQPKQSKQLAVPATKLFHNFDNVESIQLTFIYRASKKEIKCTIPKELWGKFRSAFENATPEPDPAKWEGFAHVNYRSNGKDFEATLYWINNNEVGFRQDNRGHWRNIDREIIEEVAQERDEQ